METKPTIRRSGPCPRSTIPPTQDRGHGPFPQIDAGDRPHGPFPQIDAGDRGHGPLLQIPLRHPGHSALRRGRASLPNTAYLVTATIDGRARLFQHFTAAHAAARCFENPDLLRDARMLAWVLMPDHVHWLVQLGDAGGLDGLVNRLKSASARMANAALQRSGPLWAKAYHDRALRREENLQSVARYVVANPLRAGLVSRLGDYPFWNAIWL